MEKASRKQLKLVRELLRSKRARIENKLFVADGLKIVKDLSKRKGRMECIIMSEDFLANKDNTSLINSFKDMSITLYSASMANFKSTSTLKNSQGIMALVKMPSTSGSRIKISDNLIIVLCDGIQDPGNLGTILRSSSAFGVDHVLLMSDIVDIYNPKIVRASSGTLLDIPSGTCDLADISELKARGCRLIVSEIQRGEAVDIAKVLKDTGPVILAFGSEGRGIRKELRDMADNIFFIPTNKRVDSLNVNAAVAITLYEISRGRK